MRTTPCTTDCQCTSALDAERVRGARPYANHQRCRTGVCRMHGGKFPGAPKGNRNAWKHGHYSAEFHRAAESYPTTIVRCGRARTAPSSIFKTRQRRIDLGNYLTLTITRAKFHPAIDIRARSICKVGMLGSLSSCKCCRGFFVERRTSFFQARSLPRRRWLTQAGNA